MFTIVSAWADPRRVWAADEQSKGSHDHDWVEMFGPMLRFAAQAGASPVVTGGERGRRGAGPPPLNATRYAPRQHPAIAELSRIDHDPILGRLEEVRAEHLASTDESGPESARDAPGDWYLELAKTQLGPGTHTHHCRAGRRLTRCCACCTW